VAGDAAICRQKKLPYDLEVNGLRVQCKMSSQDQVVDIRPARPLVGDRDAVRAYSYGDYDILAVFNSVTGDRYFVPSKQLVDGNDVRYMQKWFRWDSFTEAVDDWTVFETSRPAMFYRPEQKQKSLFASGGEAKDLIDTE